MRMVRNDAVSHHISAGCTVCSTFRLSACSSRRRRELHRQPRRCTFSTATSSGLAPSRTLSRVRSVRAYASRSAVTLFFCARQSSQLCVLPHQQPEYQGHARSLPCGGFTVDLARTLLARRTSAHSSSSSCVWAAVRPSSLGHVPAPACRSRLHCWPPPRGGWWVLVQQLVSLPQSSALNRHPAIITWWRSIEF